MQRMLASVAKRAGIERRVSPHVLRPTYATRLLRKGFDIREVQELLGHASVATTQVYTHVKPEALLDKLPEDVREALAAVLAGEGDLRESGGPRQGPLAWARCKPRQGDSAVGAAVVARNPLDCVRMPLNAPEGPR